MSNMPHWRSPWLPDQEIHWLPILEITWNFCFFFWLDGWELFYSQHFIDIAFKVLMPQLRIMKSHFQQKAGPKMFCGLFPSEHQYRAISLTAIHDLLLLYFCPALNLLFRFVPLFCMLIFYIKLFIGHHFAKFRRHFLWLIFYGVVAQKETLLSTENVPPTHRPPSLYVTQHFTRLPSHVPTLIRAVTSPNAPFRYMSP
jgi:hypothetical protein